MKSILKKIVLVLVILMLLFSINSKVYAWSEIISKGDAFIGEAEGSKIDQSDLKDLSGFLYNTLLSAGVVIAVIVATVLGIQFMMGGAEGQAKVKEMLIPFVVGCVVVFGGFGIWKLALSIGNKLETESTAVQSQTTTYTQGADGKYYCDNCGNGVDSPAIILQVTGRKCPKCERDVTEFISKK